MVGTGTPGAEVVVGRSAQDLLFRIVLGVPALLIAWEAIRTLLAVAVVLLVRPPTERLLAATIDLLAGGVVPGAAMIGCAALAVALAVRYPHENRARSLALLVVSVGLLFAIDPASGLVQRIREAGTWVLPGTADLLPSLSTGVLLLVVAGAPAWMFWYSATHAGVEVRADLTPGLARLVTLQRRVFATPMVLVAGAVPFVLAAYDQGRFLTPVAVGTFGLGVGSIWLSHVAAADSSRGRTLVVIGSLCMPALAVLIAPWVSMRAPDLGPFFGLDVIVLVIGSGLCAMVFGLSYAVFVGGAVGPGLVVRRGVLLGGGTLLLAFLFAGAENLLTDLVVARVGLPGSTGTFLSAGFVAVIATVGRRVLARGGRGAS